MKKAVFALLVLSVLSIQQGATGHSVYIPYLNWAVHGGCTYNNTYCMFYAQSTTNAIVPTGTIHTGDTKTLSGRFTWTLGNNPDYIHPSYNISYKWCDQLIWKKPNGDIEELINHGIDGNTNYYVYKSVNAGTSHTIPDNMTHNSIRTMTQAGTHYLVATSGVEALYPEVNDNNCLGGWQMSVGSDSHSFVVY